MSLAGTIQRGQKEITIDYPITEVKDAIMKIFKDLPGKYVLRKNDINEVFNTYHFPVMSGINPVIIDMSLKNNDGKTTTITITASNATGSFGSNSILEGHIQDYLLVLGKVLSNEQIEDVKKAINTSGCMVLVLFAMTTSTLVYYLLSVLI
ncbi:MAG: hypothetical protein Q7V19_01850 [Bacteroidales bacterium]|nr:hypothetical protein [Bacteroidales bacterium]MDP2236163.1 hypothetical protein [Bacteroidales bacterium]